MEMWLFVAITTIYLFMTDSNSITSQPETAINEQENNSGQDFNAQLIKIVNNCDTDFRRETKLTSNDLRELLHAQDQTVLPYQDDEDRIDLQNFDFSGADFSGFGETISNFDFNNCKLNGLKIDSLTLLYFLKGFKQNVLIDNLNISDLNCGPYTIYSDALAMHVGIPFRFEDMSLPYLKATNTILKSALFTGADLRFADFTKAVLSNARFKGANIEQANFTGSNATPEQLVDCLEVETITIDNKDWFLRQVNKLRNKRKSLKSKLFSALRLSNDISPAETEISTTKVENIKAPKTKGPNFNQKIIKQQSNNQSKSTGNNF